MHRALYLLFISLIACSQQKESVAEDALAIDFDITKENKLGPEDLECIFIPLETKDECLLSLSFEDVQFYDDRIFIINFSNNIARVLVFNSEGRFITQIGQVGQGPGEYLQPYKLNIDKDKNTITIADRRLNRLVNYDLDSYKYLSGKPVLSNFETCIWLPNKVILWCYDGGIDMGNRKWYYAWFTDDEMEIVSTFHETTPQNYIIGHNTAYKYKDQAYIGIPFSPLVYKIDAENMIPAWKLSFGEQKLPPKSLVVDEKENSMAWQSRVMLSDYIIAFHAHETSDCLGVSFYGKSFKHHLGFYDKRNKATYAYTAEDFMKSLHLYGVYEIITTYNDYFVARAEPRLLKKYTPKREDLRQIAERMTEEDNPVLCLFKLK